MPPDWDAGTDFPNSGAGPEPQPFTTNPSSGLSDGEHFQEGVNLMDFHAHMPAHNYIWGPTGELWPAASVNARIPPQYPMGSSDGNKMSASKWLDAYRPVEQMTWAPGRPQVISDRLVSDGGWIDRPGCNVFNLYRPPAEIPGHHENAGRWLSHLKRVYPEDVEHLVKWMAHRIQRPWEKINHAIVLGGAQGIGKDTILEPIKHGIGAWNFAEVSPQHLLGRFNGFVKSVILRISEARDLGDVNRFAFYDHMKAYTAAPPDVLRVDEKHLREYAVFNVCGVVITTNHKTDGIYLPADDRRHYVAWSDVTRDTFSDKYWLDLYRWYREGGIGHVVAYLRTLDLSEFDPKAPPPKTRAFYDIVSANQAPEDAELADTLETLDRPAALTLAMLTAAAPDAFKQFLNDRRNNRLMSHRLDQSGYVRVRNEGATDGMFKLGGRRCVIYARNTLSVREQIAAAHALIGR